MQTMNLNAISSASNTYAAATSRQGGRQRASEAGGNSGENGLSPEDAAQVAKLKEIDRKVRQHEMAHMAAGSGMITSGASFTYQKGPDGVNYAVAGEVGIDTSPGRTPDETISRAQRIRAAALAPADPSSQDRAVAAAASQMEQEAKMDKSQASLAATSPARELDPSASNLRNLYAGPGQTTGNAVNTYA